MPRVGGIDVLRRLKSDEQAESATGGHVDSSAEERDIVESYHLGVNSYLVKPVNFSTFTDVIAHAGLYWAVMNRSDVDADALAHACLCFGAFNIDPTLDGG